MSGHVIRLITLASPRAPGTEHDGRFVVEFEPGRMDLRGFLHGGKIVTTDNVHDARRFTDPGEALAYWQKANGVRPDGKPNRPLTAWTAEITRYDKHVN